MSGQDVPSSGMLHEQPHFEIESTIDRDVGRRLRTLERRISENPNEFQTALTTLGSLATAGSLEYSDRNNRKATLKRVAGDMLTEFFSQRYDAEMSFDDETEDALSRDESHRALLIHNKSLTNERLQVTLMGSKSRPNEEAIPTREQIRRDRLEFYIRRVQRWNETHGVITPTKDKLRSTG